jgi:hypothetical protein
MERELKKSWRYHTTFVGTIYCDKPDGYRSSQFAPHYKYGVKHGNPVIHMNHKSGDKRPSVAGRDTLLH